VVAASCLPTGDARAHPAYLGRPPGRPGPTANHLPRQRPSPSRPFVGPARPAPASRVRLQPRADDAPSWTRRATTPTPGHPSHAAAGLHHARDLIPVGYSGRRNARTPDAGRWRPDSGHLDAQTPAPDTGHWTGPVEHRTLAPDTGHRMLDTNADTVTTAQLASGPPWPPRERPQAETPNRACALARPAGCSAAPPAKPRPAYCCPQTITSRA
jgi:hypothetical protein